MPVYVFRPVGALLVNTTSTLEPCVCGSRMYERNVCQVSASDTAARICALPHRIQYNRQHRKKSTSPSSNLPSLSSRGFRSSGTIQLPCSWSNGSRFVMSGWVNNTAEITVPAPLPVVWELWQDKSRIPTWMPWISSVEPLKNDRSRWLLSTDQFGQHFEFSWVARDLPPVKLQKIHWESEEGLNNRGAVQFSSSPGIETSTRVEIQICYEVPDVLVPFGSAVSPLVEQVLLADLQRFSEFACKVVKALGKQSARE
jgi:uncharacterized membrane protein